MSTILIAEDEPAVLEVMCDVVESLGHHVLRAHDGAEALTLAREHKPVLVITDYMMPRLSGLAFVTEMRSDPTLRDTRVILMSAAKPAGSIHVDAFLAKPFGVEAIEELIDSILEKRLAPGASTTAIGVATTGGGHEDLLAWISHEVRTPLAAAKMHLQLLERAGLPDEGRARQHLHIAARQLNKIEVLTNSLLDAARLNDGRIAVSLREGDVVPTLRAIVREWQETVPDAEVVLKVPDDAPMRVSFDEVRLRQILDNLIANAFKHGEPTGRVEIEIEASAPDGHVVIKVKDHGPGIPDADLPHLFQRFRTSAPNEKPHGLGLYIASELARLHGGALAAGSSPGNGATFALSLPRVKG